LDLVHRYSRGIPRLINLVCEHALIVGYVEQIQQITPSMVEGVATELELETQPFMVSSKVLGGDGLRSPQSTSADGTDYMTAFRGNTPGRQDR
jgi:general secretion pathway protein A